MNLWKLFKSKRSDSSASSMSILSQYNSAYYSGNAHIVNVSDEYTAMKIAAVFRCVDILSSGVASLPLEFKRFNKAEGYFVDNTESLLYYLLTVKSNSRLSAYELIKGIIVEKVLRGNAYIIPRYSGYEVSELILCSPNTVVYDKYRNNYTINDATNHLFGVFSADEVIHIRNFSLDGGYTGVSTITYAASVLGISATADRASMEVFATGGRIKGLVSNDLSLGRGFVEMQDSQIKDAATKLQEQINAGQDILSAPGDAKFSPMSISQKDMELLASKQFGVLEICRFFGVHPDKVFAGQSANYKASEMSQVSFLTDTLAPTLRQIEIEFTSKLVTRSQFMMYKFEFDKSSIYTTDLATEGQYMTTTIANGVMTINEWRAKKDLKPIEGGDEVFISCNVAPIGSDKINGTSATVAKSQINNSKIKGE